MLLSKYLKDDFKLTDKFTASFKEKQELVHRSSIIHSSTRRPIAKTIQSCDTIYRHSHAGMRNVLEKTVTGCTFDIFPHEHHRPSQTQTVRKINVITFFFLQPSSSKRFPSARAPVLEHNDDKNFCLSRFRIFLRFKPLLDKLLYMHHKARSVL